jgi:hypothetical protein
MGAFSFAPGGKKRKFAGAANRPDAGQNAEPSPILGVIPHGVTLRPEPYARAVVEPKAAPFSLFRRTLSLRGGSRSGHTFVAENRHAWSPRKFGDEGIVSRDDPLPNGVCSQAD